MQVTLAMLASALSASSTDANGWSVYNLGNFKFYVKTVTIAAIAAGAVGNVGSVSCPVGLTVGTFRYAWSVALTTGAEGLSLGSNQIPSGSATSFNIFAKNNGAATTSTAYVTIFGVAG